MAAAAAVGHRPIFFFFLSLSTFAVAPAAGSKVPVALYYETLCPYCSNFMVNYLPKIFANGLISIVDLDLVPYGNAHVAPNASITCQHGPWECFLNAVEACAIDAWPDVEEHFKFIYCIESLVVDQRYTEWESCFQRAELDSQAVSNCYNSGYSEKLELQYAAQTDALQPRHKFVPWVLVNGVPLYDDYRNFEIYICRAYDGEVPKVCEQLPLTITEERKTDLTDRVCLPPAMTIFLPTVVVYLLGITKLCYNTQ